MDKDFKIILNVLVYFIAIAPCWSQNENTSNIDTKLFELYSSIGKKGVSEQQTAFANSTSGDAYIFIELRKTLGAINSIIMSTGEEYWINQQKALIDNIIQTSRVSSTIPGNKSFHDEYRGWISVNKNRSFQNEVPLFESYSFLYITQFLFLIRNSPWFSTSNDNRTWWNNTLEFIEKNIWTKWYERSLIVYHNHYRYFLRGRIHMGSHWAGIAMYLSALSTDTRIRSQTAELIIQYDTLLKRNLRLVQGGYIWNSTYDNTTGTFAKGSSTSIIQDVSHGNHVVTYIVAAFHFGNKHWGIEDIKSLANTLKEDIYDAGQNRFHDYVDGSDGGSRPGWGNFVSDGWLQLAAFDNDVYAIFKKFENSSMCKKYNLEFQFKANLFKINRENEKN